MASRFLNAISKRRSPSAIREMTRRVQRAPPGSLISLAGGLPNPRAFPFTRFDVTLDGGKSFTLRDELLAQALQYSPTEGIASTRKVLMNLMNVYHGISTDRFNSSGLELLPSPGSQDGLCKVFEAVLDSEEPLLCEQYCYSGMIAAAAPLSPEFMPLKTDQFGIRPESIAQHIKSGRNDAKKPKILYVCPTGSNPTGITIPTSRRKEIYSVCCEFDLLIVEDDPYFFLQFEGERQESFLSLDKSESPRVVRLDSFSKILSAGLRFGWITGPVDLIHRVLFHQQASFLHVPSLTQVLVSELFEIWGDEGFETHLSNVQSLYKKKRDLAIQLVEKYLGELCQWTVPSAGMFLWLKLEGVEDSYSLVMDEALKSGVALLPGKPFLVQSSSEKREASDQYVRLSYSLASGVDMETGLQILAEVLKRSKR